LLLKNYLHRTGRARSPRATPKAPRKNALDRARSIATSGEASEEDIRHTLIAGILIEEFGSGFSSDARFQEVVRGVVQIISADDRSRTLFDKAIDQLKASGAGQR